MTAATGDWMDQLMESYHPPSLCIVLLVMRNVFDVALIQSVARSQQGTSVLDPTEGSQMITVTAATSGSVAHSVEILERK